MALKAEEVYGALTSYVDDTLKGAGALKGAPCTIKNIVKVGDENTVTFEWTKVDGNKDTSDMIVNDGATPVSAVIDADNHVIFTMSDGRNIDGGELPQAKVEISKEAGNALTAKEDGLFVAKGSVEISAEEGNIIKSKADGLYAKADEIKKSAKTDNILTIETDGLFVPKTTDNNYSDVEKKQVSDNKDAIAKLNDNASVVGSVAYQIADALGKLNKLEKRIVSVLPAIADADANTIYLIKQGATSSNYDMYTLVTLADGSKSLASMGGTEIDLDGYLKSDDAEKLYLALADVDKETLSNLSTIKETIAGVEVLSLAFNGTKLVKPSDLNDYVAKEQGAVNVGKSLIVGADGKVTLGNAQIDIATTFGTTPSDDKVPSEKLVKDSLDAKADSTIVTGYTNLDVGADLNTLIEYGTYRTTTKRIDRIDNVPIRVAGMLEVRLTGGVIYQTYKTIDDEMYIRSSEDTGVTWADWKKLSTGADGLELVRKKKVDYDALSEAEKNDPTKLYDVYDEESLNLTDYATKKYVDDSLVDKADKKDLQAIPVEGSIKSIVDGITKTGTFALSTQSLTDAPLNYHWSNGVAVITPFMKIITLYPYGDKINPIYCRKHNESSGWGTWTDWFELATMDKFEWKQLTLPTPIVDGKTRAYYIDLSAYKEIALQTWINEWSGNIDFRVVPLMELERGYVVSYTKETYYMTYRISYNKSSIIISVDAENMSSQNYPLLELLFAR